MSLTILMLLAGALHGLGADHLAAISTLREVNQNRSLVFFSIRFALGHTLVIALAAGMARFGWHLLPASAEVTLDVLGGSALILAGIGMTWLLLQGRKIESHFHFSMLRKGKAAVAVGGLLALSGLRSMLVIIPVAASETLLLSAVRVAAFTSGIALAMIAYGLFGDLMSQHIRKRTQVPWVSYFASAFSIVAGALVIYEHIHP